MRRTGREFGAEFIRRADPQNLRKNLQKLERSKMKKIGILTSGGDCQSLNAAMRGVAKALYEKEAEIEIYGILDGIRA